MKNTLFRFASALTALVLTVGETPLASIAHAEEDNSVLLGDVNLDGCVDAADIQAMKELLGSSAATIFAEEAENNTAYDITQEGLIDARDLYALTQYVENHTAFPTQYSGYSDETVHMRISDGECFSGSTVTLDVGFVEWTKDIAGYDIILRFDNCFTVSGVSCTGEGMYAVEGNAIKLFGNYTDKEAWRGNIASITLKSEEQFTGLANVAIEAANVFDSAYTFYQQSVDQAEIDVYDVFAPVGVKAAGVSSKSTMITWAMPFSDQPVVSYSIYRDGELLAEIPAEEQSYRDETVALGTSYTYTLRANLDTGVQSNESRAVTAAPQMLEFKSAAFTSKTVTVTESDLLIRLQQPIMLDTVSLTLTDATGKGNETIIPLNGASLDEICSTIDVSACPTGTYSMSIVVKDIDGTAISQSFICNIYTNPPEKLSLEGYAGECCVILTWAISAETTVTGYRLYRKSADAADWTLFKEIKDRMTLSYTDIKLSADTNYSYAVTALNSSGAESEMSNVVSVTPIADTTPPEITYFVPKESTRISGNLFVSVQAKDSSNIVKIYCELSADEGETWTEVCTQANSESGSWYLDTTAYADGVYLLRAMAEDACGLITTGVNRVAIDIDNTAPAQVQGVTLEQVLCTAATVSWENVPDADCSHFLVTLTDAAGKSVTKRSVKLGIALERLRADSAYTLSVVAVDKLGNQSVPSETLEFSTPKDLEAPVIIQMQIQGSSVRAGGELRVYVVAKDTAMIEKLYLEYSQDMKNWVTLDMQGAANYFTICDEGLKEGLLYLRAYAEDEYGNLGDKESAKVATLTVDNTPPTVLPTLKADVLESSIRLSWNIPEGDDIAAFTLMRANAADGEYTPIVTNTTKTFCMDNQIQPATTYYYILSVTDKAGNESAFTEPLAVRFSPDAIAPKITAFYVSPQNAIVSEAYSRVQVIAVDNLKMDSILLEYQCDDTDKWTAFTGENTFNSSKSELRTVAYIPKEVLQAQVVRIRVTPMDAYDNAASPVVYTMAVDNRKPTVTEMTAERSKNYMEIAWSLNDVSNVTLMTLLRAVDKVADGKEYILAHFTPKDEICAFTYQDSRLETSGNYTYRLEVTCANGNTISKTLAPIAVQAVPVPVLDCETAQRTGVAYMFDATGMKNVEEINKVVLDYGDGTCMTANSGATAIFEHTYTQTGTYTAQLTCTNTEGYSDSIKVTIHVEDASALAQVTVTVKDTAGAAAANTTVYVDVGTESQVKYETDSYGKVTFLTTAGSHEIGVFGNGYLPATKLYNCISGAQNQIDFAVVKNQLVTASFNITRMNFAQIQAAGISVSDPENCQIVKIDVSLEYVGNKSDNTQSSNKLTIYYDSVTGQNYLPPEVKDSGYQVSKIVTNKKREIDTVVLLHIPTEVKFLKEFFNVEMIVINNADEGFTIDNSEVTLNLPNGLTLMESAIGSSARTVSIGSLEGGKQPKSVNWIVRGDIAGSYKISADFSGTLTKFNEQIHQTFVSEQNINVNGISAVDVTLNIGSTIRNERLYIELMVKNNSSVPVYALSTDVGEVLLSALRNQEFQSMGAPKVSIAQTRFKGTDDIWIVKDELTDYIEQLNVGETFSVLYEITDFSNQYAFTFLKYVKDSLSANVTIGSRAKVNVTNVSPIDTDSIYYGIQFNEETDYMVLVQNKARRALADASVKLYEIPSRYYSGGQRTLIASGTTDRRGRLVIPRGSTDKYYQLCVECEGYRNYTDSMFGFTASTANHQTTVTLSGSLESGSYKLSAAKLYAGETYQADLLTNSYSVMEGETGQYTLAVASSADAVKFELYQGTYRVISATAEDGYGELSFRITSLSDGQVMSVRTYAPTGDYVATTIHLTVVRRPADIQADLDKAVKETIGDTGSVQCDTPPEMLQYGWTFSLNIKFPELDNARSSIEVDDSKLKANGKNGKFTFSEEEISLSYKINIVDHKIVDKKELKMGTIGSLSFGVGFEFTGKIDLKANNVVLSGSVIVALKGSIGGTIGEWVTPPVYINAKVSADVTLTGTVSFNINMTTDAFEFDSFSLTGKLEPQFELAALVGIKGIIGGGIYGHLDFVLEGVILRTNGKPYFKEISLKGDAGLVGEFLGFEGKIKMLEGKITFLKNDGTKAFEPNRNIVRALTDSDNYAFTDTPNAESAWNGKLASEAAETVLSSDAYTGCVPVLASDGENTIMVWIANDASRGAGNAKHLVYSVYNTDAETWSNPLPVDANLNAEYQPVLYVANDGIYLAYQESEAVFEDENTMELTEYALQTNLMTAKYNADTMKFGAADVLVQADGVSYASAPEFVNDADGKLYAFWQCNKNGNVFANDAANAICYAQMTDEGWSEPTELVADLPNLSDFACCVNEKGTPVCAYVINPASDPLQQAARELYWLPLGGEATLLQTGMIESLRCCEICGSEQHGLVWMENGCFYTCKDGAEPVVLLDAAELLPTGELAMAGDQLFFTGYAENGTTLYTANYDSEASAFTTPVVYKNEDNAYYQNINAIQTGSDVMLIAKRESVEFTEEDFNISAALVGEKFRSYTDLTLYDCAYAIRDAMPNTALPMNLCIKNNGNRTIHEVIASLTDESGNQIHAQNFTLDLASGAAAEFEFAPVLPENCGGKVYTVTISAVDAEDTCLSDNTAKVDLTRTDLRVNACMEYDDEKSFVTLTVTNDSSVPSAAVVKAIAQSTGKETLQLVSDIIEPHMSVFWTIDVAELLDEKYHDYVDIIVEAEQEDADLLNNSGTLILTNGGYNAHHLGDINFDAQVDEKDAVLVLIMFARQMLASEEDFGDSFSASQHLAADVNGDNVISEYDATLILRYYAQTLMLDAGEEPIPFETYLDRVLNGGSD